jgi:glycosyltransferase involved in cell wall biosynthesis
VTLVSVLIACYNAAPWVGATLDSVLAQAGAEVEVLVVNDGSTDDSARILAAYERRGVRVITQANAGLGAARNTLVENALGEYLQFLDADDLLDPGKTAEQLQVLSALPPGRVAISRTVHFRDGSEPSTGVRDDNGPWLDTEDPAHWLIELFGPDGRGGMVHPGAYLVPREVAERAGPSECFRSYDADGEYFGRVLLASSGIVRTAPSVSYYRKFANRSSMSGGKSADLHWGALQSLDLRAAALLSVRDTERARRGLARGYLECAVMAYPRFPGVTSAALERVERLGGTDYVPGLGGRTINLVRDVAGWKVARRLSGWWNRP